LVAGLDLDVQHEAEFGDEIGMVGMRRAPWLVRVVLLDRPFLMAIEPLDGRVGRKGLPRRA
jgi:hypothetical protein